MELNLKISTPIGIALDTATTQVDFEAIDGFFTLLPRHADMVSALKSGILSYKVGDKKSYVACHNGVLVKKGSDVSVSTKLAILGSDLKELQQKIAIDFKAMEQERKEVNLAMAKLELGLAKGILSLKQDGGAHGNL
ncbi:MAG: F0F1 ATP synthase subunit epsilon [Alphaproteobacteria bacterium]|nr:F0F1 ATP synthase subunit epsilon [Alphaproteobacteria bacterium]